MLTLCSTMERESGCTGGAGVPYISTPSIWMETKKGDRI